MIKHFMYKTHTMLDEPHEKFIANVVLMLIFWAMYYYIYTTDPKQMVVNKAVITNKETKRLGVFDFAWFSTLTQFGITFGDITPRGKLFKSLIIVHAIIAWFILLH